MSSLPCLPVAPARVRRSVPSSPLPPQPQQTPPAVQTGTGAAARHPKHSVPEQPAAGGEGPGRLVPEQPVHLCPGAGDPAGGGQAGEEAERHV